MLDWGWRMHWTSTCPTDRETWWWVGDDLGMHDNFWAKSMALVNIYLKNILVISIIENYNLDPSRLVFQHDNDPKHTSKIVRE